jgi:hypothetical protein
MDSYWTQHVHVIVPSLLLLLLLQVELVTFAESIPRDRLLAPHCLCC